MTAAPAAPDILNECSPILHVKPGKFILSELPPASPFPNPPENIFSCQAHGFCYEDAASKSCEHPWKGATTLA